MTSHYTYLYAKITLENSNSPTKHLHISRKSHTFAKSYSNLGLTYLQNIQVSASFLVRLNYVWYTFVVRS